MSKKLKKVKSKKVKAQLKNNINLGTIGVPLIGTFGAFQPAKNFIFSNQVEFMFENPVLSECFNNVYDDNITFNSLMINNLYEPYHTLLNLINKPFDLKLNVYDIKRNVICFLIYRNFEFKKIDKFLSFNKLYGGQTTINTKYDFTNIDYYPVLNKKEARKLKLKNV